MHHAVAWVLFWWAMDGIGLVLFARVVASRRVMYVGLAEFLVGGSGLTLVYSDLLPDASALPVLVGLVALMLVRRRDWRPQHKRGWSRRWHELGEPYIWTGLGCALAVVGVLTAIALNLVAGAGRSTAEAMLWGYFLGSALAVMSGYGGLGLAANRFSRWLIRVTVPASFLCAVAVLAARL